MEKIALAQKGSKFFLTREEVQSFLYRREGVSLDFKSKMYELDSKNPDAVKWQKGEMIRDILSLANQNVSTVGRNGFLVLGVADKLPEDGPREVIGISSAIPEPKDLINKINAYCDPPLEDINCEEFEIDGKRIVVLVVPANPHVYETTDTIHVSENRRPYTERTVFIRRNEHTVVANTRERIALDRAKRSYFSRKRGIRPTWTGLLVGLLIGPPMVSNIAVNYLHYSRVVGFITGLIVFGFLGAILGNLLGTFSDIFEDWSDYSLGKRILVILFFTFVIALLIYSYLPFLVE